METKELKEKLCMGLESGETNAVHKVEKVLAPFMLTLKKRKKEKVDVSPGESEEPYHKRTPKDFFGRLQAIAQDPLSHMTLLNEMAELLKVVTKSKSANLYLIDIEANQLLLCPKYVPRNPRYEKRYNIESGTYLAAHVAFTKEYVISSDILGDVRFPRGIPDVPTVKSALCVPIITNAEGELLGVIEFYRDCSERPYDLIHLQIATALTAWMGVAVRENKNKIKLNLQVEAQEQVLHIASSYFSGCTTFNKVVSDIVKLAKIAGSAEKAAFYFFDEVVVPGTTEPIYADAYEEYSTDPNDSTLYLKGVKNRYVKDGPGIVGYVARSGEKVNVRDAYKDPRFDKKGDSMFFRTRSVAAFPIKNESGVVAVIKLTNNLNYPFFRDHDLELMDTLLRPVSLLCNYYKLDTIHSKTQYQLIAKDKLLGHHLKPSNDEFLTLKMSLQSDAVIPEDLYNFDCDLTNYDEDSLKYIASLFLSLSNLEPFLDTTRLLSFLCTVKKSYRAVLFHNFEHAFSVFHCTVNIIIKTNELTEGSFQPLEVLSMLIAALCHDVDHSGFTNNFLILKNDITYKLYGEICGENHRYNVTAILIQNSDLLYQMTPAEREFFFHNLKRLMLSFDLTSHFQHKKEIVEYMNENSFDWNNTHHRFLAQHIVVHASEFSYNYKSFEYAKKETFLFYKELYTQGDLEKTMGFTPMVMLDRNKSEVIPENQIILLTVVTLPCLEILSALYPSLNVLETSLKNTMDRWTEIITLRGLEMWNLNAALVTEKKERRPQKVTLTNVLPSLKDFMSYK